MYVQQTIIKNKAVLKPILSVKNPYNGGINAPPTIAVHNNPDAFGFNSPKPLIAKVKIETKWRDIFKIVEKAQKKLKGEK